MKRKLMAIIALIAVGTLLFASAPQEASTGEGPVELKFWSLFTGGDGAFFDAMIEEFNASQDEIHMTNDMVKFDDYYTKLTTALAAGNAPDVIVLHQARLINYVPSGVLLPLDEYVSDEMLSDFQAAPLEACRMDGKLYAIPFDVHPIVMYTNTSLLEEAGIDKIPETAEEFTAAAKAVKEATGQWGSLIDNTTGTYKAYTLTRLFVSLVNQQGGSMLTEDMSAAAFNNEYGYNALVWLQSLVNEEAVNPNELDYDAAMHDNVDPVVLKIGAEINKWARSLKNDGPEKGMLFSMARFNLLVYGNYCGKGNNGKAPIDDLDGACQAHDTCYAWGGNNEKCNQEFRQRLLTIMQKTSLFDYKHIVAVAAYKLFGG